MPAPAIPIIHLVNNAPATPACRLGALQRATALAREAVACGPFARVRCAAFVIARCGQRAANIARVAIREEPAMGPKITAALAYLARGGGKVVITSLDRTCDALHGEAGTTIVR